MTNAAPLALAIGEASYRGSPRRPPEQPFSKPQALVHGLLAGDESAAAALFDQYAPLVRRTIASVLGPDAELSDAVQDAFISALRTLSRLRDPQALPQWMRRVAVRTAVDRIRRRERRRWLSLADPAELSSTPAAHCAVASDAVEATFAVLKLLSVEQRTLFALRYFEGLELREIADSCELSLATVKRRLSATIRRFRALALKDPTLRPFVSTSIEEGK